MKFGSHHAISARVAVSDIHDEGWQEVHFGPVAIMIQTLAPVVVWSWQEVSWDLVAVII